MRLTLHSALLELDIPGDTNTAMGTIQCTVQANDWDGQCSNLVCIMIGLVLVRVDFLLGQTALDLVRTFHQMEEPFCALLPL